MAAPADSSPLSGAAHPRPQTCPHCGAVQGAQSPLAALYQEVARIREIAERQGAAEQKRQGTAEQKRQGAAEQRGAADTRHIADRRSAEQETIERLTREVQMLRETVARLRGTGHRGATRPLPARSSAA